MALASSCLHAGHARWTLPSTRARQQRRSAAVGGAQHRRTGEGATCSLAAAAHGRRALGRGREAVRSTASRSSSNHTNPKPGGLRATHASLIVPKSRKKSRRSRASASGGKFPTKTCPHANTHAHRTCCHQSPALGHCDRDPHGQGPREAGAAPLPIPRTPGKKVARSPRLLCRRALCGRSHQPSCLCDCRPCLQFNSGN